MGTSGRSADTSRWPWGPRVLAAVIVVQLVTGAAAAASSMGARPHPKPPLVATGPPAPPARPPSTTPSTIAEAPTTLPLPSPAAPPPTTTTVPAPPPVTPAQVQTESCHGSAGAVDLTRSIVCMASTRTGRGYWLVGADGGVFAFGDAAYYGSVATRQLVRPIVGMAPTADDRGYWLASADGGVFAFGDAGYAGGLVGRSLNVGVTGIAPTVDGKGYWLTAADGGVFAFGDAPYLGSLADKHLNTPVVGMAATPDGRGYWMVSGDGGVFGFGDAPYLGSLAGRQLNVPVAGLAPTPDGQGYWMASSDGGVFAFGDAPYLGGLAGDQLAAPIVGIAPARAGRGYWLVGADGGVFTYGSAAFLGSTWMDSVAPVILASAPHGPPPEIGIFYYPWYATAAGDGVWRHWDQNGHQPPGDIGSDFFPARGAYSSSDATVVDQQLAEIAQAGVQTLISSWWGRGSYEDGRMPLLAKLAAAHGLKLAAHLEPYGGRSAAAVASDLAYLQSTYGITEVYVYRADLLPAGDWATVTRAAKGVQLFATGDSGALVTGAFEDFAKQGGFSGVYTYDPLLQPADLVSTCRQARARGLKCAPSVAPGYTATQATNDRRARSRNGGATYDAMWNGALAAAPDAITITSYNEWHEGTQIEPAVPHCGAGYCSNGYIGDYGNSAAASPTGYLGRTRQWVDRTRG